MALKYLLDTCVLSEIVKAAPNPNVLAWLGAQADVDLCLSAVTIGEIRKGIELAKARRLATATGFETWLTSLVAHYASRILPFDEPAAQVWGRLMAQVPGTGIEDSQIAAIALAQRMTVVTRNLADFVPLGVPCHDPF